MCFGSGELRCTSYSFMRFQKATLGTSLGSTTATLRHALAGGLGAHRPHVWSRLVATSYSFMRFQKATLGTSLGSKTATLRHALARGLGAQEPHFWSGLVAHTLSQNLQENSFDSSVMPESEYPPVLLPHSFSTPDSEDTFHSALGSATGGR